MTDLVTGPATAVFQQRWEAAIMGTYGTPPLALVKGHGAEVWDADGKRYLDLLAGIAVNALGHAHPAIIEAVTRQLTTLGHTSNLYVTEPGVALAERLLALLDATGEGRVFFGNSGTEANECALKLARRYGAEHNGRDEIVACQDAFHGRTLGALAVTGNADKREPFTPLPGRVTFLPYGDIDALRSGVGQQLVNGVDAQRERAGALIEVERRNDFVRSIFACGSAFVSIAERFLQRPPFGTEAHIVDAPTIHAD